jgi:hypothetical protein
MGKSDDKVVAHLNSFSIRAIEVVAAARWSAGRRGAKMIEMGDLLLGIVVEDTGTWGKLLSDMHEEHGLTSVLPPLPFHSQFFPSESVGSLRTSIETFLPQSKPIAPTIELPLSPDVEHIFDGAKQVQSMFHHQQIQPLHLLAAVLIDDSDPYVKVLQDVGITEELVLETLRGTES